MTPNNHTPADREALATFGAFALLILGVTAILLLNLLLSAKEARAKKKERARIDAIMMKSEYGRECLARMKAQKPESNLMKAFRKCGEYKQIKVMQILNYFYPSPDNIQGSTKDKQ